MECEKTDNEDIGRESLEWKTSQRWSNTGSMQFSSQTSRFLDWTIGTGRRLASRLLLLLLQRNELWKLLPHVPYRNISAIRRRVRPSTRQRAATPVLLAEHGKPRN